MPAAFASSLESRAEGAKASNVRADAARAWMIDRVRKARLHRFQTLESYQFLVTVASDAYHTRRMRTMQRCNVNQVFALQYQQRAAQAWLSKTATTAKAVAAEKAVNIDWLFAKGGHAKTTLVAREAAYFTLEVGSDDVARKDWLP